MKCFPGFPSKTAFYRGFLWRLSALSMELSRASEFGVDKRSPEPQNRDGGSWNGHMTCEAASIHDPNISISSHSREKNWQAFYPRNRDGGSWNGHMTRRPAAYIPTSPDFCVHETRTGTLTNFI
eukprot:s3093_g8.t1